MLSLKHIPQCTMSSYMSSPNEHYLAPEKYSRSHRFFLEMSTPLDPWMKPKRLPPDRALSSSRVPSDSTSPNPTPASEPARAPPQPSPPPPDQPPSWMLTQRRGPATIAFGPKGDADSNPLQHLVSMDNKSDAPPLSPPLARSPTVSAISPTGPPLTPSATCPPPPRPPAASRGHSARVRAVLKSFE